MKRSKKFKIKYVYIDPKTPEEKEQQQKILDDIFDPIFDKIAVKLKNDNQKSKRDSR